MKDVTGRPLSGGFLGLLVLGCAVIVAASVYTLTHMSDRTVFRVLVPSVVIGLILVGFGYRLAQTRHN